MAEQSTRTNRRVCLLSGGGDAPGVNAIVRGFVHAARRRSIDVVASRYGFEGLLDERGLFPLSTADVRGILPKGGSMLGCSTRLNPFFVASRTDPWRTEDMGPRIVARLHERGIDTLVLIGGDGTLLTALRFMELGMPCIHVPKTIDNDLGGTDVTCGFASAVDVATKAIDALHSTAEAHARVMLVEVMGRSSGWIALHAGVAGGADVILIPEMPYKLERIVTKIRERQSLGMRFSIVVVAEGARPTSGEALEVQPARPGHLARLGGAGGRLLRELESAGLDQEIRLTVLGHLQRGGSPSSTDRRLGTELGTYAAQLCCEGVSNQRIVVHQGRIRSLTITPEAPLHRLVTPDDPLVRTARLVGIELAA